MNNPVLQSLKFIFLDIIGDFIYWPVWWYTVGLKNMLIFVGQQIRKTWKMLALGIWLKSMFLPMYGDRSITGRAISFFMRLIILAWRLVWFLFWSVFILIILVLWIVAPLAVIYMILTRFLGVSF